MKRFYHINIHFRQNIFQEYQKQQPKPISDQLPTNHLIQTALQLGLAHGSLCAGLPPALPFRLCFLARPRRRSPFSDGTQGAPEVEAHLSEAHVLEHVGQRRFLQVADDLTRDQQRGKLLELTVAVCRW